MKQPFLLFLYIYIVGFYLCVGATQRSKNTYKKPLQLQELSLKYILDNHILNKYNFSFLPPLMSEQILREIARHLNAENTSMLLYEAVMQAPQLIDVLLDLHPYNIEFVQKLNKPQKILTNNSIKTISLLHALLLRKQVCKTAQDVSQNVIIKVMKSLIKNGAEFGKQNCSHISSPLIASILYHCEEVTLYVLKHTNVDVNYQNPLYQACLKNRPRTVKALLKNSAYPDGPRNNGSPLRHALRTNNEIITKLLITHGANPYKGCINVSLTNIQSMRKMLEDIIDAELNYKSKKILKEKLEDSLRNNNIDLISFKTYKGKRSYNLINKKLLFPYKKIN